MNNNIKLTQKQENFCLNLFKGMYQRDAYIDAYHPKYAMMTIDGNASRLANNEKILARLAELRALATSEKVMPEIARKEKLSEFARAKLTNFIKVNGDSIEIDLDGEDNAALQEVSIEAWRGGKDERASSRTSKVKLINPITAIAELNKMDGVYQIMPPGFNDNRTINIIVSSEKAKELTQNVTRRLIQAGRGIADDLSDGTEPYQDKD